MKRDTLTSQPICAASALTPWTAIYALPPDTVGPAASLSQACYSFLLLQPLLVGVVCAAVGGNGGGVCVCVWERESEGDRDISIFLVFNTTDCFISNLIFFFLNHLDC